jgi:hypothetical protein
MQTITLSLPYDLNELQWAAVDEVYRNMDGWIGYDSVDNTPRWFGSESDARFVSASVEPSGLQLDGRLPSAEWTGWTSVLCLRLSLALGMEIRDADC